jgi:cytochrome c oxidase assembly protein subunit 15
MTAVVALLPIVVGALVTARDAGMAFPDWPTSDGHGMFAYPWLQSAGEKFLEHGHRLAGVLIGVCSIGLVALAWWKERRAWVCAAATMVLAAVIAQGLLGAQRVLLDERVLAMVHSSFAALVFALMVSVAAFTSRSWFSGGYEPANVDVRSLKPLVIATPVLVFAQYVLGGCVRHLGTALYEHIALAVLVILLVLTTFVVVYRTGISWLRRSAVVLLAVASVQLFLGMGAWITRFGLASTGYVAVQYSAEQITLRTAHTVVGLLLFATSIVLALRVFRYDSIRRSNLGSLKEPNHLSHVFSAEGGLR